MPADGSRASDRVLVDADHLDGLTGRRPPARRARPGRAGSRRPGTWTRSSSEAGKRPNATASTTSGASVSDLARGPCRSGGGPGPSGSRTGRRRRRAGTSTAGTRRRTPSPAPRWRPRAASSRTRRRGPGTRRRSRPGRAGRGWPALKNTKSVAIDRQRAGQAAHLGDRPIVGPLVDDADEQEQGAGDDAVGDHLEHRALEALLAEDEDAQRHEAHVADRASRRRAS